VKHWYLPAGADVQQGKDQHGAQLQKSKVEEAEGFGYAAGQLSVRWWTSALQELVTQVNGEIPAVRYLRATGTVPGGSWSWAG
jgi:hypothetical protein